AAGETRLLPALRPAKERLVRLIQSRQRVLQDMGVNGGVRWELSADGLQLRFLLQAREGDVTSLRGGETRRQGGGVERAAAPQDVVQRPLLRAGGTELLLVGVIGLASRLLVHTPLLPDRRPSGRSGTRSSRRGSP